MHPALFHYSESEKNEVFYSDTNSNENDRDPEVNYLPITRGFYTQRIFPHFAEKYASLIKESAGVFYTMDDNIININE